ncbi:serine threonine [Micractinium conductrix]|uniref:Serine threonine n=1 Tax=Micractinium conductrix TaxID=554055 RepID=A0A2P6V731_9CHLO|nr:serine threonine [Micractinium conductrix]|eukprot:PSC69896.1 serine threonine [Micractinium conductrix]
MEMFLELAHASLPTVPLDKGVVQANTGVLLMDSLPLLTMWPMTRTLGLFWKRGRYLDFSVFLVGWVLAMIYHYLHMHPEGIAGAHFLGLSGPTWRGLDILCAQALLARTCGHAVGARSVATQALANLVFPVGLLAYAHGLADGVLTLGVASRALLGVLLATLAAKAVVEGWHTVPRYCPRRGRRTLAFFIAGFGFFPWPERFPRQYWLYHSLWHICMAKGFYLLFFQLEGLHLAHPCGGASAQPSALAPSESSACGDSDASEVSDEEEVSLSEDASTEDASTVVSEEEEVVQQGAAASVLQGASASARAQRPAGVLAALLQPAAQLLAFQRQARVERRRAAAAASRKAQ